MAQWSSIGTRIQTKTNRIQQKTLIIRIIEMGLLTGIQVLNSKLLIIKRKTSVLATLLPLKIGEKWGNKVFCEAYISKFSAKS